MPSRNYLLLLYTKLSFMRSQCGCSQWSVHLQQWLLQHLRQLPNLPIGHCLQPGNPCLLLHLQRRTAVDQRSLLLPCRLLPHQRGLQHLPLWIRLQRFLVKLPSNLHGSQPGVLEWTVHLQSGIHSQQQCLRPHILTPKLYYSQHHEYNYLKLNFINVIFCIVRGQSVSFKRSLQVHF
jgi:hypothetical protein